MIIIVVITTYHYDKSEIYKYYHYHDDHPLFSLSLSNIVHVYKFTIRNRHADMLHVFRESRVEWSTVQIWAQITTGLREKKSAESHGYSFSRLSLGRQIPVKMPDLYSISACVSESRYIGCPEASHQSLLPNMGQFVLQFMAMWIGKMMINRWISGFFLQYPILRQSQIPEKFTRNDSPNKEKTSWPVLTAAYVLKACVLFDLVSSSPIGKAAILSQSAWMCILRFQPFLCARCFVNHIQLVLYHSQLTIGDGELLYDVGYDHPFAQSG